jgi:hypothetical protein
MEVLHVRVHAGLLAMVALLLTVVPSTLAAGVPAAQQRTLWQHACEDAAKGTVSDQEALVCLHEGFPTWSDGALTTLERVREQALGGTYLRRAEFPFELAACFFD